LRPPPLGVVVHKQITMGKIPNYKYSVTYKVNGKDETLGCKTKVEKDRALKMMEHANEPNSGYLISLVSGM